MLNQLQYCEEESIPLALVIGDSELQQGVVKLRIVETRQEINIPRDELIKELKSRLTSA